MKKLICGSIVYSTVTMFLMACSGGSGGGAGTGGTSSPLQTSKMSCNGSVCIGSGSLSLLSGDRMNGYSVSTAVELYNAFNDSMIPALNGIIAKVEAAVAQGGAESCSDIEVPYNGQVTVGGTLYNVKTQASLASAPTSFTTSSMQKGLAGQVASPSFDFFQGDVACGAGTNESPLVARVLAKEGSMQLNAWFEKGDSKHIRILMVVNTGTIKIAGWFKTNDGDLFELVLASAGNVYKAVGKKSLGSINYSENNGGDSCINATTGAVASNCTGLSATSSIGVLGVPYTLADEPAQVLPTEILTAPAADYIAWGSIGNAILLTPTF